MSWRNDWPARVKAPNPAMVVSAAPNSPRDSDTPHGQQLCEMELEPNAEHQENDSHLGELFRQRLIGYEARRVGTNDNPAHEIPDNGRQPDQELLSRVVYGGLTRRPVLCAGHP
jgi:hypothetical protein